MRCAPSAPAPETHARRIRRHCRARRSEPGSARRPAGRRELRTSPARSAQWVVVDPCLDQRRLVAARCPIATGALRAGARHGRVLHGYLRRARTTVMEAEVRPLPEHRPPPPHPARPVCHRVLDRAAAQGCASAASAWMRKSGRRTGMCKCRERMDAQERPPHTDVQVPRAHGCARAAAAQGCASGFALPSVAASAGRTGAAA